MARRCHRRIVSRDWRLSTTTQTLGEAIVCSYRNGNWSVLALCGSSVSNIHLQKDNGTIKCDECNAGIYGKYAQCTACKVVPPARGQYELCSMCFDRSESRYDLLSASWSVFFIQTYTTTITTWCDWRRVRRAIFQSLCRRSSRYALFLAKECKTTELTLFSYTRSYATSCKFRAISNKRALAR